MTEVEESAGHGVTAKVDGRPVAVGNARLMERQGWDYTPNPQPGTVVYVAAEGRFAGSSLISDQVKPSAGEAVRGLQAQGVRTVMLTGDAAPVLSLIHI